MNKDKILELYPDYTSVLGPYTRADGRKHIVLNNSKLAKGTKGKLRTVSYPKALLEVELGRTLKDDETTDHVDEIKTNDSVSNLQILTREDNARKSAYGNKHSAGRVLTNEQRATISGEKNSKAKLTNEEVKTFRKLVAENKITKQEIVLQTGMCEKSVRSFLKGDSYKNVD